MRGSTSASGQVHDDYVLVLMSKFVVSTVYLSLAE